MRDNPEQNGVPILSVSSFLREEAQVPGGDRGRSGRL